MNNDINSTRIQPLLIIGKTGTLGKAFAKICEARNITYKLLSRSDVDICKPDEIQQTILKYNPWAIVNAAGYVRVDDAEEDYKACFASNINGAVNLALYCNAFKIKLLTFSTDLVFDGQKKTPYVESDKPNPLNIYGHSKLIAEQNVLKLFEEALVVRTSAFFGPWDKFNFVTSVINKLSNNETVTAANNIFITPTYIPDLVHTALDLLIDEEKGIWHVANYGAVTWAALADRVAKTLQLNPSLINKRPAHELRFIAKRPLYSILQSEKGIRLPSLHDALNRYFDEVDLTHHISNSNLQYTKKEF